jgi:hypothetical protein
VETIIKNFPAASMRDRVNDFRTSFVRDYLVPQAPFPFLEMMFRAAIQPSNKAALDILATRKALLIRGDRIFNQGQQVDGQFSALLGGQTFTFTVNFPKLIDISVKYDSSSLTFTFTTPIVISLNDELTLPGDAQPIPSQQQLARITLSEAVLEYEIHEVDVPDNVIIIRLNLMQSIGSLLLGWMGKGHSALSGTKMYFWGIAFSSLLLMQTCKVCCQPPCGPPPPACPTVGATTCIGVRPTDSLYIRTNSKYGPGPSACPAGNDPRIPNLWTFVYLKDVPAEGGCSYKVCKDETIPIGWEATPAFYDRFGCDASGELDGAPNVRTIRLIRSSAKNISDAAQCLPSVLADE